MVETWIDPDSAQCRYCGSNIQLQINDVLIDRPTRVDNDRFLVKVFWSKVDDLLMLENAFKFLTDSK